MTAAVTVDSTLKPLQKESWKELSVERFLRQVNWSNQSQDDSPPQDQTQSVAVTGLHYQLSVGQFFSAIPWTGEVKAEDSGSELQLPVMEESLSATPIGESLPLELPDLDEFADSAADGGEDLTLDDFFDSFSDF